MRMYRLIAVLVAVLGFPALGHSEDDVVIVKKAVERSTLAQPGTKPFHLKAMLAPTRDSDRGSNRTGDVEIWWASPTRWRREVRSPEFQQIAVTKDGHEWQKNDGDYFPEWLREIAAALIEPVPSLDQMLEQVKGADVKKLKGSTYFQWTMISTDGNVQAGMGGSIAVTDSTGLLFYGGGFGWDFSYRNYQSFHDRMVARTVSAGDPEVTAKVTTLEDLGNVPPGFFDAETKGGDAQPLRTVLVEEASSRKNLLPSEPVVWPPLQDGPLEGAATAQIAIDRAGKVQEIGPVIANNPGVVEVARAAIAAMRFKPYLENDLPVQVVSRITLAFKTVRPAGVENFESAQTYFERGRHLSFPAAASGVPYLLRAEFEVKTDVGTVEGGKYVDTWISDSQWRREASIGESRYIRARHGEKRYEWAEGPNAPLLRLVLKAMEPIPSLDTFVESDWRIRRDTIDGVKTIRLMAGYNSPDGKVDPKGRAYWFDETGKLVKSYFMGIETQRSQFEDFSGVRVSRQITILQKNEPKSWIHVTQVSPAGTIPADTFELPGHEWDRVFTDEVR
ncbi:MAG TPA: hypothetical protein VK699_07725 [Terriglobales bacterium]|jgi:hypothetical protein|nr:hypothetical protein [Terriglobales bacterium]